MGTFWRHTISSPLLEREMSSEVHARTRSSERLDGPPGGAGSTSPPTTTSGAATGGGGGSSATNVVGATKASSSSSSSMLQFSEHAINQVQGLSKRGLDLPITARLQRRRYRWDFLLFLSSSLVEASSRREHHRALLSRCVYRYISVCGYDDAMTR